MVDFFGKVPDIVIDKILEKLPIQMAAQTSVLSKQWERGWLSLKSLVFDCEFWLQTIIKDRSCDMRKGSQIISDILLHHNGPVLDLVLSIPFRSDCHINHSQWIYFLSKNGIRKIVITISFAKGNITSYIFRCSKLVHLELRKLNLNPPPTDFIGFPFLKHLVLDDIKFNKESIFSSLIEKCRMLETLKLVDWSGMDHIVIDAPSLQTLILSGSFESLAFRNVRSLKSISLCLMPMPKNFLLVETIAAVNLLASSCQLRSIKFDGHLSKFFAAGDIIIRSSPITFNHLDELCLSNLNLSAFDYLSSMIKCCPYIKKLVISVAHGESGCRHTHDYDYNYKLRHLLEVNIKGIMGSSAELQLVAYLFAISPVLENLFFSSAKPGIESELRLSRALMRFPRASTKAKLVCLEK